MIGKKPRPYPKVCIWKLVRISYHKSGVAMDCEQNIIMMMKIKVKLTTKKRKTWASRTFSVCLDTSIGEKKVHLVTCTPMRDRVFS